jgi:hypothetical protein
LDLFIFFRFFLEVLVFFVFILLRVVLLLGGILTIFDSLKITLYFGEVVLLVELTFAFKPKKKKKKLCFCLNNKAKIIIII